MAIRQRRRAAAHLVLFALAAALLAVLAPAFADEKGGSDIKGPVIGIDLGTTYSCVGGWTVRPTDPPPRV